MSVISSNAGNEISYGRGLACVFAAGVLWSTVGLGIRLIEDASVWQILLYRSVALSTFLYLVIRFRSRESPFTQAVRSGFPAVLAGLALVAAYSGGIYSKQRSVELWLHSVLPLDFRYLLLRFAGEDLVKCFLRYFYLVCLPSSLRLPFASGLGFLSSYLQEMEGLLLVWAFSRWDLGWSCIPSAQERSQRLNWRCCLLLRYCSGRSGYGYFLVMKPLLEP